MNSKLIIGILVAFLLVGCSNENNEETFRETNCYMTNEMDGFLKSNLKLYDKNEEVLKIVQKNAYPLAMFPDLSDDEIIRVHEESIEHLFSSINEEKPGYLDLEYKVGNDDFLYSIFTLYDVKSVENSILSSFFGIDRDGDVLLLDDAIVQIESIKQLICDTEE